MTQLVVIGSAEAILCGMFRDHSAHVFAWRRWRFLFDRGIVDRDGIVLVGRRRGQLMNGGR
jgi:hypothetical protein